MNCVSFSVMFYLDHALGELRFDFIWAIHSFMRLAVKGAEIKMRKIKSYAITRRGSIHRQINKNPFLNKMRKINKFLIIITRLWAIT